MKIFSATQIKAWDDYTCQASGITSWQLMEQAAVACKDWLLLNHYGKKPIMICCGKGNNGGDGLAIARLLFNEKIPCTVHILETGKAGKLDFQVNLQKLHQLDIPVHYIQEQAHFPNIASDTVIIDAIMGTGFSGKISGLLATWIDYLNKSGGLIIAIDQPSGLPADGLTSTDTCICAAHTLSFESPKLAFLFSANEKFTGQVHLLKIGLNRTFEATEHSPYQMSTLPLVHAIYKPRGKFSHKGHFGHAALLAGSRGMMGAAFLAAKGCLHAGVGKLTCICSEDGLSILPIAVPEAMTGTMANFRSIDSKENSLYSAVAAGPGLGTSAESLSELKLLLSHWKQPVVLDADALNLIAATPELWDAVAEGSIITPHPKEFDRLFGASTHEASRLQKALTVAAKRNIYVVLKGHYTAIITPLKQVYFNSTGNAGMAKAGMGDVLTGIITALMAQKYPLPEAAILGVYLHGLAGDLAEEKYSAEAMQASHLIDRMGEAWKIIKTAGEN